MTEKFRVLDGEVDLEREDVRDSQNRRIDADYVERRRRRACPPGSAPAGR